jgi:hypothetical protein
MTELAKYNFETLPYWYQKIIEKLLTADFPGKSEIQHQLKNSSFEIVDKNGSLKIYSQILNEALVVKTIPVEAWAHDIDGILIQVILFTQRGIVRMLEIFREDGGPIIYLPAVNNFEVIVLGV